jgi:hypothetical protein
MRITGSRAFRHIRRDQPEEAMMSIHREMRTWKWAPLIIPMIVVSLAIPLDVHAQPCPVGTSSPTGNQPCTVCPGGTYSPNVGQTSCFTCAAGTYSLPGSASCSPCQPGHVSLAGSSFCTACAAGFYSPGFGGTSCTACVAGTFSTPGSATCTPCAAGTFSSFPGSASCSPCGVGYFTPSTGSQSCLPCAAGTFAGILGSASCVDCPDGFIAPNLGSATCQPCPPGSTSDSTHTACIPVSAVPDRPVAVLPSLGPAAPNPATSHTVFQLSVPTATQVTVTVHDVAGRLVRNLESREFDAGVHPVSWDLRAGDDSIVPPGVYYARMRADGRQSAVRILVLP